MRHIEFEARTWLHLHLHSRYCHLHQVPPKFYPRQVHLPLTEFAPFFRGQQVEDAPPLDLTKVIILDFIFVTSWVFSPDRSIWPPDFWWSVRRLQAVRRWLSWDRLRLPLLISRQSILYVWINVSQKPPLGHCGFSLGSLDLVRSTPSLSTELSCSSTIHFVRLNKCDPKNFTIGLVGDCRWPGSLDSAV